MALRNLHPFNGSPVFPIPEQSMLTHPETTLPAENNQRAGLPVPDLMEPDAESVFPATQALAQEMDRAKKLLLELLLTNSQAHEFLRSQVSNNKGEGVDYSVSTTGKTVDDNIVQDNDLVQPYFNLLFLDALDNEENPSFVSDNSEPTQLDAFNLFPAFLIRIADQVLQKSCSDTAYKIQLLKYRRDLQDIRQRMISANTGLVAFVAYKYKTSTLSFDDLMQEGIVGLIRAVDRFDPNRGIRFSTYAVFWIKQAISRLIVKQEKVVHLPVALAEKASVVFEAMRNSYLENNRWPSLPELQGQCELSLEDIKTISSYYQATHSLDASLSEENDDQTLMSTMTQHQFPLPLDELIERNLSLYLGKIVASLPEKEATILNMRFGLKNHTEMTLQAIADQLHVTRERVRQIQNEALKKLKQQFGYDLLPFLEANDS